MDDSAESAYINQYARFAVEEMHQSGVPASIKLAQALVESDAGRSILATRANNHFGIKCKSWWTGDEYFYADDDLDASGNLTASCFRYYDSVRQSFADHSAFLSSSERYAELFSFGLDYEKWACGLQTCGYATNPKYSKKLLLLIEKHRLFELDRM